ncbi:MAG: hypothetical protein AAFR59_18550, partial [Bacteroidota bacterium]
MKDQLKLDIRVDQVGDQEVSGVIFLTAEVDMAIERIIGKVSLFGRGQFSGSKRVLAELSVKDHFLLYAGKMLEVPVRIQANFPIPSYKGKNASFYYGLEAEVTIEQDEKAKEAILSKIRSVFVKDYELRRYTVFEVPNLQRDYQLIEVETKLKGRLPIASSALGAVSLFGASYLGFPEYRELDPLIIQGIASIVAGISLSALGQYLLVGKLYATPKNVGKDEFEIYIEHDRYWQIVQ